MAHKILMVEDDFALAMGTEYALTSEGYAVTTAGIWHRRVRNSTIASTLCCWM